MIPRLPWTRHLCERQRWFPSGFRHQSSPLVSSSEGNRTFHRKLGFPTRASDTPFSVIPTISTGTGDRPLSIPRPPVSGLGVSQVRRKDPPRRRVRKNLSDEQEVITNHWALCLKFHTEDTSQNSYNVYHKHCWGNIALTRNICYGNIFPQQMLLAPVNGETVVGETFFLMFSQQQRK